MLCCSKNVPFKNIFFVAFAPASTLQKDHGVQLVEFVEASAIHTHFILAYFAYYVVYSSILNTAKLKHIFLLLR